MRMALNNASIKIATALNLALPHYINLILSRQFLQLHRSLDSEVVDTDDNNTQQYRLHRLVLSFVDIFHYLVSDDIQ